MFDFEDVWVHIEFLEELDENENGTGKVSIICDGGQMITGEYFIRGGLASGQWDRLFQNNSYFDDNQALLLLTVAANFYKDMGNKTNWDEFWQYALSDNSPLDNDQKQIVTDIKTVGPSLYQA
jgi:hypothetical protein